MKHTMPHHKAPADSDSPRTLDRLIPQKELLDHHVPLDRSTVYRRVKDGTFPQPVRYGERSLARRASDIQRWMDERVGKPSTVPPWASGRSRRPSPETSDAVPAG